MKIMVCNFKPHRGNNRLQHHTDLFNAFAEGVSVNGDEVIIQMNPPFIFDSNIDVYVTWGTNKNGNLHNHMNKLRDTIIRNNKHIVCIETPILNRTLVSKHEYYRTGINHIIPDKGKFYNNVDYPCDRFDQQKIKLKSWRKQGDHIVVITQNPGDQSLMGTNHFAWLDSTMCEVKKYTDRPIILKGHPNWRKNIDGRLANLKFKDFTFDIRCGEDRFDCLENCHAAIAFSSGMSLDCIVRGIPMITPEIYNFVYPISTNKISEIETPLLGNRESLLNKLAYAQWTIAEMAEGLAWKHLRSLI